MQDMLNAIRRLYEEPGPEGAPSTGLPPEAQAEAEALAVVKAGLDALPPQRPDAATLDAVFAAAAADDTLAPVRAVYEDAPIPTGAEAETAALAAMKASLDALPPQRPDPATLAAVLAAAAPGEPAPAPARAADRAPRRPATRRRVITALSAVFALVLVFSSGLWLGQDDGQPTIAERQEASAAAEEADAAPRAEATPDEAASEAPDVQDEAQTDEDAVAGPVASATAPAARRPTPQAATPPAAEPPAVQDAGGVDFDLAATQNRAAELTGAVRADEPTNFALVADDVLPLADGDEELRLLYLRMREMQAAQAGLGWGEPPEALGAPPDSVPPSTGWMQVRVER